MSTHNRSTTLQIRLKEIAIALVKLLIVLAAFFFIYHKFQNNEVLSFDYFLELLHDKNIFSTRNIILLLIFTTANYSLECYKWNLLVTEIKDITFKESIKQTLSSLTASIITPNRIGEYGAKAIYYKTENRKKILGLNLIGNTLQMLTTILFGIIGLLYLYKVFNFTLINTKDLPKVTLVIILLTIILYIGIKKQLISNKTITKIKLFFKNISTRTLLLTMSLSVFRYLIFSHQFYFLLLIFKVDISYINVITIIFCMYLLVSIIPTIFILDLAIKSGVAILLFSLVGVNELIVLSITTLMWVMNFVIPAIIGSYFVLIFKYNKE